MKFKLIISTLLIIILAVLAFRFTQKKTITDESIEKNPVAITTQSAKDSQVFEKSISYPAILASENQVNLVANSSGTITQLNFDLGKNVYKNQRLATIDSSGTVSGFGENGLRDSQIKSLELAVQVAQQNYKLARDAYRKDDTYANKKAKEIADINYLSAQSALKGALDGQFITTPISGTVTQKLASLGDSVSFGQTIATVSQLGNLKIQFFADKEELSYFKIGDAITIKENNQSISGKISKISPQADETTKRFMIEAIPSDNRSLLIGSVVTVEFNINYHPANQGGLILPLSAITTGQNESYIFIAKDNQAQKVLVTVEKVFGEMAEIKTILKENDQVIIDGNKLLKEGDTVTLEK